MSPEGWADHSITRVVFSPTLSAFNVIDLGCPDILQYTNSGLEAYGKDVLKLHCPKKSTIIYASGEAE